MTEIEKIVLDLAPKVDLTLRQIVFLLCWSDLCGSKTFGFKGEPNIKNQIQLAIKFLKDTEKEWQDKTVNNQTSLEFFDYFLCQAVAEGIDLPTNFNISIKEKTEEVLNERTRT